MTGTDLLIVWIALNGLFVASVTLVALLRRVR